MIGSAYLGSSTLPPDEGVRALEAAIHVAEQFGLHLHEPVPLRSTNNIVAWLRPAPIVAKVRRGHDAGFRRELRVAAELSALGGPVVPPADEIPAIVHSHDGFDVTFWRYCPQPVESDFSGAQMAAALRRLHVAYAAISGDLRAALPSYMTELEAVSGFFAMPSGCRSCRTPSDISCCTSSIPCARVYKLSRPTRPTS